MRGGSRPGSGRPKGSKDRRTVETALRAAAEGLTPLEYLQAVLRDESADPSARFEAAKAAAPYIHARLAATQLTGRDGEDLLREQLSDYEVESRSFWRGVLRMLKLRQTHLPKTTADKAEGPRSTVSSIGHCNTALSLSAGVSNPKVFLGRWFKRNAILFKYD
jgi:hypothetical protein